MKELDKMLWKKEEKVIEKFLCDCRSKGYGLCFCKDLSGEYTNPPWPLINQQPMSEDSIVDIRVNKDIRDNIKVSRKDIPNAWLSGSSFISKWS